MKFEDQKVQNKIENSRLVPSPTPMAPICSNSPALTQLRRTINLKSSSVLLHLFKI